MRKTYRVYAPQNKWHNGIEIAPKTSNARVISIILVGKDGTETHVLDNPIDLDTIKSIDYKQTDSSIIDIQLEHVYVDDLDLNDIATLRLVSTSYVKQGSLTSNPIVIPHNEKILIKASIDNIGDCVVYANVSIICSDKFGNRLESGDATIGLGSDSKIFQRIDSNIMNLHYEPLSIEVWNKDKIITENDYSINGKELLIKLGDIDSMYAIYKPKYIVDGLNISENIVINPDLSFSINVPYSSSIEVQVKIGIIDTDYSSANATPVIKSLAIISADK